MATDSEVFGALSSVRDPELDRPITDLGFVSQIKIQNPFSVRVELRLPTYFCAPNFAWLMMADARDAVVAIPGTGPVSIVLLDHFAAAETRFTVRYDTTDPAGPGPLTSAVAARGSEAGRAAANTPTLRVQLLLHAFLFALMTLAFLCPQ